MILIYICCILCQYVCQFVSMSVCQFVSFYFIKIIFIIKKTYICICFLFLICIFRAFGLLVYSIRCQWILSADVSLVCSFGLCLSRSSLISLLPAACSPMIVIRLLLCYFSTDSKLYYFVVWFFRFGSVYDIKKAPA